MAKKVKSEEIFDKAYYYGGKKSYEDYDSFNDWAEEACVLIKKFNFKSILDVGCGLGNLLYEIHKLRPDIVTHGCEISDFAKKNNKMSSIFHGHFLDIDFKEKYDVVLFYSSLTYFEFSEVVPALKKAFNLCNKAIVIFDVYGKSNEDLPESDQDKYRKVFLSEEEWLDLLHENFPKQKIINDKSDEEREFLIILKTPEEDFYL